MSGYAYRMSGSGDRHIAVAVRDPGGVRCVEPVIQNLTQSNYTVLVCESGWALENQIELSSATVINPLAFNPEVVIRTPADVLRGAHALDLSLEQKWADAVFVDVEDYPGASDRIVSGGRREPNVLLVMSDLARLEAVERRPQLSGRPIIATGNPDFDVFATVDTQQRRFKLREQLGLHDEPLILYVAQLPPSALYVLQHTVAILNALQSQPTLCVSFHPRTTATDLARMQKIAQEYTGTLRLLSDGSSDLGYAADLVVTAYSTEGLKSVFRKVPVLYVGFPKEFEYDYAEAYPLGEPPLPVRSGAAFWIQDVGDHEAASPVLVSALTNGGARRSVIENGTASFKNDGKAGERVLREINRIFEELKSGGTDSQTG